MTILISGGDSFTYGNELEDCDASSNFAGFSKHSWSYLLSKRMGWSYGNTAWGGLSNAAIARRVLEACENLHTKERIAVVVMWSFPNRYEFRFNYDTGERYSPWHSITPWTHERDQNVILDAFNNFNEVILNHYKRNQLMAQSTGLADFSKMFFKHVGDSEYWETYSTLKEIVLLSQYLELKKIPYFYTCVDNTFLTNYTVKSGNSGVRNLLDQLDFDHWYKNGMFEGFYPWAQAEKFPFGTTHPLEPAHERFCDLIFTQAEQQLNSYKFPPRSD